MIGTIVAIQNETDKNGVFGLLIDVDSSICEGGKIVIPCNRLLFETKQKDCPNKPLLNQKVEIKIL